MLAKIAPRFVISRVIQNAYYANYMAIELSKRIIGESAISFYTEDAKKYFVDSFSYSNATFMDIFQAYHHQQNLQINLKPSNIIKLSLNFLIITKFELSIKDLMNLQSN